MIGINYRYSDDRDCDDDDYDCCDADNKMGIMMIEIYVYHL